MNEHEEWRAVIGWEGLYEVSDLGRVRRSSGGKGTRAGYVLRDSPTTKGYRKVGLCDGARQKTRAVHKLVAEAFIGPSPDGMEVNHIDTDRTNNRRTNLEYVTPQGNSAHMAAMGHSTRGERAAHTHLTERDIRCIRALRRDHVPLDAVAFTFKISKQAVCDIAKGRTWKHVA